MRLRRLVSLCVLIGVGAYAAWQRGRAQQQRPNEEQGQQRDVEDKDQIAVLIEIARASPAEFAADVLIRIAQSTRIKDRQQKAELLEEAFQLASGAQHPMARNGLPGSLVDTRSGYLGNAYRLKLDRVSLQARVVQAMLGLEKQKARELFAQMPKLELKPLRCADALVYDVSGFYGALKSVTQATFSQQEMEDGEHVMFLEQYVRGMSSPVEVEPLTEIILSLQASASQLELLISALEAAVRKIPADDRSFSFSMKTSPVIQAMEHLAKRCKELGISNDGLLGGFRAYLVNQLSGPRCGENITREPKDKPLLPGYIESFNNNVLPKAFPSARNLLPISENEIKPSKIDTRAETFPYWQSSQAKELLSKIRTLRFAANRERTEKEKGEPEWQEQLLRVLSELEAWNATHEPSEADYFHQKCILYRGLLLALPAGSEYYYDDVLIRYARAVSNSPLQKESRIEWFMHVRDLLDIARSVPGDRRARILESLRSSGNTILNLYAEIEGLAPEVKKEAQ